MNTAKRIGGVACYPLFVARCPSSPPSIARPSPPRTPPLKENTPPLLDLKSSSQGQQLGPLRHHQLREGARDLEEPGLHRLGRRHR
eukprot:3954001-Pyramimonas_sp.AAC.1